MTTHTSDVHPWFTTVMNAPPKSAWYTTNSLSLVNYEAHMPTLRSLLPGSLQATAELVAALDSFLKLCTVPQTKLAQDALRRVYAAAFASPHYVSPEEFAMKPTVTLSSKIKRNDTRAKLEAVISPKGIATLRKKAKAQKRLKNGRFARGVKKAAK